MNDKTTNIIAIVLILLAVICHYIDQALGVTGSDLSQGLLLSGTTLLRIPIKESYFIPEYRSPRYDDKPYPDQNRNSNLGP